MSAVNHYSWYKVSPSRFRAIVGCLPSGRAKATLTLLAMIYLDEGGLPDNDARLAFMTGLPLQDIQELSPAWEFLGRRENGCLVIDFLEDILAERANFAEKMTVLGSKGGKAKAKAKQSPEEPETFQQPLADARDSVADATNALANATNFVADARITLAKSSHTLHDIHDIQDKEEKLSAREDPHARARARRGSGEGENTADPAPPTPAGTGADLSIPENFVSPNDDFSDDFTDLPPSAPESGKLSQPLSPIRKALCLAVGWRDGTLDHSQWFNLVEAEKMLAGSTATPEKIARAPEFYRSQKKFSFAPKWIARDWSQIEYWLASQGSEDDELAVIRQRAEETYERLVAGKR